MWVRIMGGSGVVMVGVYVLIGVHKGGAKTGKCSSTFLSYDTILIFFGVDTTYEIV